MICSYRLHHMGNKNLDLYFAHWCPKKPTGCNVLSLVSFLPFAEAPSGCYGTGLLSQTLRCDPHCMACMFSSGHRNTSEPLQQRTTLLQLPCNTCAAQISLLNNSLTVFTLILIYYPFSCECLSPLPIKMLKHQF